MSELNFSDSAATHYDTGLVPIVFKPWAEDFLETRSDWQGKTVLDLAAGTAIVTRLLADKVGPQGTLYSVDINPDMLAIAQQNCAEASNITFIEASADDITIPDESIDIAVCQQGFQFFSDKPAAVSQLYRVLRPGGSVMLSTWCRMEDCEPFNVICQALESIGEQEASDLIRVPFDYMPAEELENHFSVAGFKEVTVQKVTKSLVLQGGIEQAVKIVHSIPIAHLLNAFTPEKKTALKQQLVERYENLTSDGKTFGLLNSNLLTAQK